MTLLSFCAHLRFVCVPCRMGPPCRVFGEYPNIRTYMSMKTKTCTNEPVTGFFHKATAQPGTEARVRVFSARCWLEVSLHPEGPAAGQLHHGFPWFPLISEQMLSWFPNSMFLCSACFTCSPPDCNFKIFALIYSPKSGIKFHSNVIPLML
jgi:hypothetical protein